MPKWIEIRIKISGFLILLLLLTILISNVNGEIDKISSVTSITDGDTFDISTGETVRLADINAPEFYQAGGNESKDYLRSLVYGRSVYLDEDDLSGEDQYGRLICVVYVDYNLTHFLNVNDALLVGGYAVEYDFTNNEFDPDTWALFVLNPTPTATLTPTPIATTNPTPSFNPTPNPTTSPTPTLTPNPSMGPNPDPLPYFEILLILLLAILAAIVFQLKRK